MFLLIGFPTESLGLGNPYGVHYEAERTYDFCNLGDSTQSSLNPQIMVFGQVVWTY